MPHGAKYGASKQPNRPRLTGCVEAVFQAMATHQKIGPVQGAGLWALAALGKYTRTLQLLVRYRSSLTDCLGLQQPPSRRRGELMPPDVAARRRSCLVSSQAISRCL